MASFEVPGAASMQRTAFRRLAAKAGEECGLENRERQQALLVLNRNRVVVLSRSFVLQAGCYGDLAELIHLDYKIDRPTTDFAVFDIFLGLDRTIDQYREAFPAIRALHLGFDKLVNHDAGRMRNMRPLSVEK
jgi:hypothetical protein